MISVSTTRDLRGSYRVYVQDKGTGLTVWDYYYPLTNQKWLPGLEETVQELVEKLQKEINND